MVPGRRITRSLYRCTSSAGEDTRSLSTKAMPPPLVPPTPPFPLSILPRLPYVPWKPNPRRVAGGKTPDSGVPASAVGTAANTISLTSTAPPFCSEFPAGPSRCTTTSNLSAAICCSTADAVPMTLLSRKGSGPCKEKSKEKSKEKTHT
jgi:hypothetical protein